MRAFLIAVATCSANRGRNISDARFTDRSNYARTARERRSTYGRLDLKGNTPGC